MGLFGLWYLQGFLGLAGFVSFFIEGSTTPFSFANFLKDSSTLGNAFSASFNPCGVKGKDTFLLNPALEYLSKYLV